MKKRLFPLVLLMLTAAANADEKLLGIACRSVHLQYPSPSVLAFYNRVSVTQSAPGTYFCVIGFNKGYFGLQELANGKKLLIFSVWDPGSQNNPNQVADEQRVKMLYKHDAVRTGRFGNEGTGGQSFYDFDWQLDTPYEFFVTSTVDGQRTVFTAHFMHPQQKQWMKLVTFSTPTGGTPLGGCYSFLEDFRRNRESTKRTRTASFGPGWAYTLEKKWQILGRARFTADSNPATNINAGVRDGLYFLSTGGEITNTDTPLREQMSLPNAEKLAPPTAPME